MEETRVIMCKDCKRDFEIEHGEMQWYRDRGWDLPVRCPDCRAEAKARRARRKEQKKNEQ